MGSGDCWAQKPDQAASKSLPEKEVGGVVHLCFLVLCGAI